VTFVLVFVAAPAVTVAALVAITKLYDRRKEKSCKPPSTD
jgi:hypothetical protein